MLMQGIYFRSLLTSWNIKFSAKLLHCFVNNRKVDLDFHWAPHEVGKDTKISLPVDTQIIRKLITLIVLQHIATQIWRSRILILWFHSKAQTNP